MPKLGYKRTKPVWNAGKRGIYSLEYRKKLSEAHKANPNRYWLGKTRSLEDKTKMRIAKIGKYLKENNPFWRGGKPKCLDCGVLLTTYKPKRCLVCSIKWRKGAYHYNWQGGLTPKNTKIRNSTTYKLWRKSVFERDNFTCQECGVRGVEIHADHIKPFAYFLELRFELSNGRTLCVPCHKKTDTYLSKTRKVSLAKISMV